MTRVEGVGGGVVEYAANFDMGVMEQGRRENWRSSVGESEEDSGRRE